MSEFLQTIMGTCVAAAVIIGIFTVLSLIIQIQMAWSLRMIKSGKISNFRLNGQYRMLKSFKDDRFWIILNHGIYYQKGIQKQNELFEIFRECMIKRHLPL